MAATYHRASSGEILRLVHNPELMQYELYYPDNTSAWKYPTSEYTVGGILSDHNALFTPFVDITEVDVALYGSLTN